MRGIIASWSREDDVERIVIGLPLHTSGREGQLAALTRSFGDWLAGVTGLPVFYFDERYTTVEAEHRLIDAGLKRQKRKALRDQLAAQIMLQGYLDAGCPETEAKAAPLADDEEDGSSSRDRRRTVGSMRRTGLLSATLAIW